MITEINNTCKVVSLTRDITIYGFSNGNEVCFFESNAEKVEKVTGLKPYTNYRGTRIIHITERDTAVIYPKLIRAGYRIAITDN